MSLLTPYLRESGFQDVRGDWQFVGLGASDVGGYSAQREVHSVVVQGGILYPREPVERSQVRYVVGYSPGGVLMARQVFQIPTDVYVGEPFVVDAEMLAEGDEQFYRRAAASRGAWSVRLALASRG